MDKRKVRSYVLRAGRISEGQKNARKRLADKYLIHFQKDPKLDIGLTFGNNQPTYVEIGFGMGDTTVSIAKNHPQYNRPYKLGDRVKAGQPFMEIRDDEYLNGIRVCRFV